MENTPPTEHRPKQAADHCEVRVRIRVRVRGRVRVRVRVRVKSGWRPLRVEG